jgi:hypothetical protein
MLVPHPASKLACGLLRGPQTHGSDFLSQTVQGKQTLHDTCMTREIPRRVAEDPCGAMGSPAFKVFSQRFPRVRLSALGDGLRRVSDNQSSALVSAFRPKVEDPIRTFDHIEVVFDHQH